MAHTKRGERIQKSTERLLQLGSVSEPPVPIEQIAQLRGTHIRYVPFEGELSGLLLWENGRIVIGVNQLHSKTRQRFAIAHQLGHLELHYRTGMHIDRNFPLEICDGHSSASTNSAEVEANAFASELLLPISMLERDVKGLVLDFEDEHLLRQFAKRYGVSLQVMIFRLVAAGLLIL